MFRELKMKAKLLIQLSFVGRLLLPLQATVFKQTRSPFQKLLLPGRH